MLDDDMLVLLACPQSGQKLVRCTIEEADRRAGAPLAARADAPNAKGKMSKPFGRTAEVLLREDRRLAYPIVDGIPILLAPEALTSPEDRPAIDLTDPRYAEAYEEMEFYNQVARREAETIVRSEAYEIIRPILEADPSQRTAFPEPRGVWLDAVYDCAAQWDGYSHLAPVVGQRVMQLGGKGIHAVKMLLAGADEAWLVTPMLGEALFAHALAEAAGVAGRIRSIVAIAEELGLADESFDGIYAGGCVHHMQTGMAFPEAARVLREGGRFVAIEPWRAPLYAIGTKILGQREKGVYCKPLTPVRLAPLWDAFGEARVVRHGTFTRYPLLALDKFGIASRLSFAWYCNRVDDAICSVVPGLRGMGSSVALLARKRAAHATAAA